MVSLGNMTENVRGGRFRAVAKIARSGRNLGGTTFSPAFSRRLAFR